MRQQSRPWSLPAVLLLATSHSLLPAASASPLNVANVGAEPDYGYWDISFSSSNAASGYRWEDVYANYSRTAGTTIHCHQLYNVTVGQTTRTCDDASFGYDLTGGSGQQCRFACLGTQPQSWVDANNGVKDLIVCVDPRHYRTSNCQP